MPRSTSVPAFPAAARASWRGRAGIAKVLVATAVAGLLLFLGQRGRREVERWLKLELITEASGRIRASLDDHSPTGGWLAAEGRASSEMGSLPVMLPQETRSLLEAVRAGMAEFDARYRGIRLPEGEALDLRLARAALATADQRYQDALALVTDADEAEAALGVDQRARRATVLWTRGRAYFGLRDWKAALERYRKLGAMDTNSLVAQARIADCQLALGEVSEATAAYRLLAVRHEDRGRQLLREGKAEPATVEFGKAIEIQQRLGSRAGDGHVEEGLGRSCFLHGTGLLLMGRADAAAGQFAKSAELQARTSGGDGGRGDLGMLALAQRHAGDALLVQEKPAEAAAQYSAALETLAGMAGAAAGPDSLLEVGAIHVGRGNALLGQKSVEGALADYSRAIAGLTHLFQQRPGAALAAELGLVHNNRGAVRRAIRRADAALRDFDDAVMILTEALQKDTAVTPPPGARSDGIKLEVAVGFSERSVDVFTRVRLAEDGGSLRRALGVALGVSLRNRGHLHLARGSMEEAIRDLQRSMVTYAKLVEEEGQLDLSAQLAQTLTSLAWLHATAPDNAFRDAGKATRYAQKACELSDWKALPALEAYAAARADAGDFDAAVKWQERALEIAPRTGAAEVQSRLDLYKSRNPFRAPPGGAPQ